MAKTGQRAPGPRGLPITGTLWWVRKDVLNFLRQSQQRYGDVVRFRMAHIIIYLVNSPEGIKHVLKTNHQNYLRTTATNGRLKDVIGDNVLTTDGNEWAARRKAIAPLFSPQRSSAFVPMMAKITMEMVQRWRTQKTPVTINTALMETTLAIITEALFGLSIGADAEPMEKALSGILAHHWRRVQSPMDLPHRLPTQSRRTFTAGNKVLRDILARLRKSADPDRAAGILARFEGLSVDDELLTLLLAGHETTANALSWAFWLLTTHTTEQDRLHEEARQVYGDRMPSADEVSRLPHATRVFEEAMRLYPPIWLLDRLTVADDDIQGFHIPAKSTVVIAPWLAHRHPDYWPHPEAFHPDRFTKKPTPFSYLPFGAGPHGCVGGNLAMVEGPLIISLVARYLRLKPAMRSSAKSTPTPMPGLTLRMMEPYRVRVESR